MEERKFDPYQLIGFILIALIMTWMLMNQQPVEATNETPAETEVTATPAPMQLADSIVQVQNQATYGSFADLVQSRAAATFTFENEVLSFTFSSS